MKKLKSTKPEDIFPLYIEFITTNEIEMKMMKLRHSTMPIHRVAMFVFGFFALAQLPIILNLSVYWLSVFPILTMIVAFPYLLMNMFLRPYMKRHEITEFKWFLFKKKLNKVRLAMPSNIDSVSKWINMMFWFESNIDINDFSVYTTGFTLGNGVTTHNYIFKNEEDAITFKLQFGGG